MTVKLPLNSYLKALAVLFQTHAKSGFLWEKKIDAHFQRYDSSVGSLSALRLSKSWKYLCKWLNWIVAVEFVRLVDYLKNKNSKIYMFFFCVCVWKLFDCCPPSDVFVYCYFVMWKWTKSRKTSVLHKPDRSILLYIPYGHNCNTIECKEEWNFRELFLIDGVMAAHKRRRLLIFLYTAMTHTRIK